MTEENKVEEQAEKGPMTEGEVREALAGVVLDTFLTQANKGLEKAIAGGKMNSPIGFALISFVRSVDGDGGPAWPMTYRRNMAHTPSLLHITTNIDFVDLKPILDTFLEGELDEAIKLHAERDKEESSFSEMIRTFLRVAEEKAAEKGATKEETIN